MRRLILILFLTSFVFADTAVINSFSAGELSPLLEGRSDVRKYYSGCRTLENMIVLPHGGATKRPGTYYICDAKDHNTPGRLIPFEYSVEQAYVLELGDHIMRFYKDGGQITSGDTAYEISTPYDADDIFEMHYIQSADTMYFAHSSYPPMKLTRSAHTSWTLEEIDFKRGPFLDQYYCSAAETQATGNVLLASTGSTIAIEGIGTASGSTDDVIDGDDNTYYRRRHTRDTCGTFSATAGFDVIVTIGSSIERIHRIEYKIDSEHTWESHVTERSTNRQCLCYISTDGTNWTLISTSTVDNSIVDGSWNDVTHVRLAFRVQTTGYVACAYGGHGEVSVTASIYELRAYGTPTKSTTCNFITPTNQYTYDRTLDNAAAADAGGGDTRFPCTAHGFLQGDYVIITGCDTDAYNGTHEITNVESNNTFDVTVAYSAETFDGDEQAASRIALSAVSDTWNSNHVGALWELTHTVPSAETTGDFTAAADNSSSVLMHKGQKYDFTTSGNWQGIIILQRSYDSGTTWKDVIPHRNHTGGENIAYSDSEDIDDCLYRAYMYSIESGDTCTYSILQRSHDVDGVVEITSYIDAQNVLAIVDYNLGALTPTKFWAEGAWSDDEGYPSTLCFYEERQCFAATTNQPQTIWMSQTDDWDNFRAGSDDTDAITITIAADQVNTIRWMLPQTSLLAGTIGGEWKISATKEDEPLSPSNINAKRQSNYGSANIQAINIGNNIIYLQRQNQKVRQLKYSWELDNWVSPDLTLLNEHITGNGLSNIDLMKNPYPVLWCVRSDGDVATLTFEENQEVLGWTRHIFDGDVESLAIIPGTYEDEVWIEVERTINSSTVRYIEQMQSFDWGTEQEDCFFVDSGLTFDSGPAVAVTNITQAVPGVVTAATHGFSDGDNVRFYDVNGMTYVNGRVYTVSNPTTDTFELRDKLDEVDIDTRGCVGHWKMDDNAANTTVEDVYGHDGTATVDTEDMTFEGVVGSSLYLDASTHYIDVDDSDDFTFGDGSTDLPFSISVWWKTVLSTTVSGTLVGKMAAPVGGVIQYTNANNEYLLMIDAKKPTFFLFDGSEAPAWIGRTSPASMVVNTWYHVVATYDGSGALPGMKIYVDGTQVDDANLTAGTYVAMENLTRQVRFGEIGDMYLDDARIFSRELTSVDIENLYNGGRGTEKPVGYCQYIDGGYVRKCENTFTNLYHLEGETVSVLQDGGDAGTKTVSGYTITLDDYYYVVHAGLPYTAKILPMKLELSGNPGSLFGMTKKITECTLRFYKTSGCDIGKSWTDYESMVFRDTLDALDEATPLFTDDKTIAFSGSFEKAGNIYVQNRLPLPFTVLALMCKFETEDR